MGSPDSAKEVAPSVSTPADPKAAAAGWEAAAQATASADGVTQSSAPSSEVTELKGKVAALEQRIESLITAMREGLHNRVNELEQTIKRKFPYG